MKKNLVLTLILSIIAIFSISAQDSTQMRSLYINENVTTHIFAGDPISYVDISTHKIIGNQPEKTFIRLKPIQTDSLQNGEFLGIVTIISERFKSQYQVYYTNDEWKATTDFEIPYYEKHSYLNPQYSMSLEDMYQYGWGMLKSTNAFYDKAVKQYRLKLQLNNIYTLGNYFFLDISLENNTNIQYDFEEIKIFIEDKKKTKATNFQTLELPQILNVNEVKSFKRGYRTVIVIEKLTFPDQKNLLIEVSEKQISGRTITLKVDYSDVLHADMFIPK